MNFPKQIRYGLKFKKLEPLNFIGHLDLMRLFERLFRRAHLPVVYSQGFNPQPKMSLAQPLPVGVESEAEYLEFYLTQSMRPEDLVIIFNKNVPPGIVAEKCFFTNPRQPSLTAATKFLIYEAEFEGNRGEIEKNIQDFLSGQRPVSIFLIRKAERKEFNLKPADYSFEIKNSGAKSVVILRISYYEGVPMHATEIYKAVTGFTPHKVVRKEIIFR